MVISANLFWRAVLFQECLVQWRYFVSHKLWFLVDGYFLTKLITYLIFNWKNKMVNYNFFEIIWKGDIPPQLKYLAPKSISNLSIYIKSIYLFQVKMRLLLFLLAVPCIVGQQQWVPCSELNDDLRYPCRCKVQVDRALQLRILMNCDRVVFPGDFPSLPYGAPIISFSQRFAGQQTLPTQVSRISSIGTFFAVS